MAKVVIMSPVDTLSGYGFHSRDIIRSIIRIHNDWDIKLISLPWGQTPRGYLKEGRDDDLIKLIHTQPTLTYQPDILIQITVPSEFNPIGKYNIGITAGIETTVADPTWVEGCNRMDLVISTSNHSKDVLMNSKFVKHNKQTKQPEGQLEIIKPVEVLFEGSDLNIYKELNIKDDSKIPMLWKNLNEKIKEEFAFLYVGHWLNGEIGHSRKDTGGLIKSFVEAFKNYKKSERPALILKTGSTFSEIEKQHLRDKINSIIGDNHTNIYLLNGKLSDEEINELYNYPKVKAMVSTTKGEGYGRPLQEFALSGKPVIASKWSGQLDFLKPEYSILISGELRPIHKSAVWKGVINKESKWFYANHIEFQKVLRSVYKSYDKYINKAIKQKEHIENNFSLTDMDNKFLSILNTYVPLLPSHAKLKLPVPKLNKVEDTNKIPGLSGIELPKLKIK